MDDFYENDNQPSFNAKTMELLLSSCKDFFRGVGPRIYTTDEIIKVWQVINLRLPRSIFILLRVNGTQFFQVQLQDKCP